MSQNTIAYANLQKSNYLNLARDLSWMNSKNHEHTDRDGHVLGYICNIKIHSPVSTSMRYDVAPNTWKMRNSFRKWHAYRSLMFTEAGVSDSEQGRYGKTIRPYLDFNMKDGNILNPIGWETGPGVPPEQPVNQTQEWTYTQIAAAPGFQASAVGTEGAAAVDVYELHICGENQDSTTTTLGTEYYSSVGMIHSYNQDRQEVVTPTLDSQTIEGHNNPLALLRQAGAVSGGAVMDIVQDQELEAPPYDINDNGWSIYPALADIMQINPGYDGTASVPVLKSTQLFVPAGLLYIGSEVAQAGSTLLVDVVGIVRCKDMA